MTISDVQLKNNYYTVFDERGKKIKEIHENHVGELCGFGSDFIVFFRNGLSLYSTYDETGNKIKDMHSNHVGDFHNASGSTITFQKGSYIGTYDCTFKRLSERHS
jgi:hypothetical protein